MFRKYAPPTCKQVKQALKKMGFADQGSNGTSHNHRIKIVNGHLYKVTVDCPKAPFGNDLVKSMSRQAGVSKNEFLKYCHNKKFKTEPSHKPA